MPIAPKSNHHHYEDFWHFVLKILNWMKDIMFHFKMKIMGPLLTKHRASVLSTSISLAGKTCASERIHVSYQVIQGIWLDLYMIWDLQISTIWACLISIFHQFLIRQNIYISKLRALIVKRWPFAACAQVFPEGRPIIRIGAVWAKPTHLKNKLRCVLFINFWQVCCTQRL